MVAGKQRVCMYCSKVYYRKDRFEKHVAKCKLNSCDMDPQCIQSLYFKIEKMQNEIKSLRVDVDKLKNPPVPKKLESNIQLTNLDLFELWERLEKKTMRKKINTACNNDPMLLPYTLFEYCLNKYPLFANLGEQNKMVHAAIHCRQKDLRIKDYDTMENLVQVFANLSKMICEDYINFIECPQFGTLMLGNNQDFHPQQAYKGWIANDLETYKKKEKYRMESYMIQKKVLIETMHSQFIKRNVIKFKHALKSHLANLKRNKLIKNMSNSVDRPNTKIKTL